MPGPSTPRTASSRSSWWLLWERVGRGGQGVGMSERVGWSGSRVSGGWRETGRVRVALCTGSSYSPASGPCWAAWPPQLPQLRQSGLPGTVETEEVHQAVVYAWREAEAGRQAVPPVQQQRRRPGRGLLIKASGGAAAKHVSHRQEPPEQGGAAHRRRRSRAWQE